MWGKVFMETFLLFLLIQDGQGVSGWIMNEHLTLINASRLLYYVSMNAMAS